MDIVVCIKQVPEVQEAELEVLPDGQDILRDDLVVGMNEWDTYAVEEALRLREAHGGRVTVITVGADESLDMLRRALAMGADEAVRIDEDGLPDRGALGLARALGAAIRQRRFDLCLCGAQSQDIGAGAVGPMLARLLDWPFATLAMGLELRDGQLRVLRELEADTQERVALELPCLVTVQTGLNQPRYVSVMGIRKTRGATIRALDVEALGLDRSEVGPEAGAALDRFLEAPPRGRSATLLQGSLEARVKQAAAIIREAAGAR